MTAQELLELLNTLDEHTRIEAKTSSQLGRSTLESVCAFSNEPRLGGGWILLGVKLADSTLWPMYQAIGISDIDKVGRDLTSQCSTVFNQQIRLQVEPETLNGKCVLKVFVPELPAAQKPLYFKDAGLPKGAFRRQGSADVHCTEDDLLVFYHERRGETYDSSLVPGADLSHIDNDAVAEYRRMRAEVNPDAEELKWSDEDLLQALACAVPDGVVLRPTVAGILLFGTAVALRRFFPLMRVDYIRVPGKEWISDPDRRFETIEIRAPLIHTIRRARNAVLDDLPKAFSLPPGQLQRQEIPIIPDRVLREAVVNTVMHRSYRVNGPIQIIRYANRLEIRNPGHSLVAEDRLGEPGSENRNPIIAAVLHETNMAENKGSGIRVMRELMVQANLTPPAFESDREKNIFIVTMLFHHFLSPEDWTWLRNFDHASLNDEEARALVFVREAGAVNNSVYRDLNRVDVLNASLHLRRLRDIGLLQQKGKGANTFYVPTDKLLSPLMQQGEAAEGGAPNPAMPARKPAKEASRKELEIKAKVGSTDKPAKAKSAMPDSIAEKISSLSKKATLEVLMHLAESLCAWQPLTTAELAEFLKRNRTYIKNSIVTPMLKAGRLFPTIPDQPKHPQQRYTAGKDKKE